MNKPSYSPLLNLPFAVRRALGYPMTQPVFAAQDIFRALMSTPHSDQIVMHDIHQALAALSRYADGFQDGFVTCARVADSLTFRFASANGRLTRTVQLAWSNLERRFVFRVQRQTPPIQPAHAMAD